MDLNELRKLVNEATEALRALVPVIREKRAALEEQIATFTPEQIEAAEAEITDLERKFETAEAEVKRTKDNLAREERLQAAVDANPPIEIDDPEADDRAFPAARGSLQVEAVYAPDKPEACFMRDILAFKATGDPAAAERLMRNQRHMISQRRVVVGKKVVQARDVTTADPGAAGFIPPVYLAELAADLLRFGRPFADVVRARPLPDQGMTLTIPKVQSGTTVAIQAAEGDDVSETDIDTQQVSVPVRTIAGQNDISLQALERSFPGMDEIIFEDLVADYDEQLDVQLLAGTGSSGQVKGIRAVSGITDKSYTDATPTVAEALPRLYDVMQGVATSLKRAGADTIVLHPRRSAWFASGLSTSFPIFQQGQLTQAVGQQNVGFTVNPFGLNQVIDGNIGTTYSEGGSTNEDEVYFVRAAELILMEGALRMRTHDQILGGKLITRLQVFAYVAFASDRRPEAIGRLKGSGLSTPAFT